MRLNKFQLGQDELWILYQYETILGQYSSLGSVYGYGYPVLADFRGLELADKTGAKGSD